MRPKLRPSSHIRFRRGRNFDLRELVTRHGNVESVLHGDVQEHARQGKRDIRFAVVLSEWPGQVN